MTATNTKTTTRTPPPAGSNGQVAILTPPRLMPPADSVLTEYDVNREGWRTLVESIFPAAKTVVAVMMALDYCKRRKLDIFKHPVHIVPIWNAGAGENGKGAMVETIWPGINELRTTAIRTGQYAGMDIPAFGTAVTRTFEGKIKSWKNGQAYYETQKAEVAFPEWCQITVYRTLGGNRVPFPGPRVFWLEAYARLRNDVELPNAMWQKRANGQLEKCAEAAALRRAFPEELGSDYSIDEIGAFTTHAPTDITDEGSATTSVIEPKRADFKKDKDQAASTSTAEAGGERPEVVAVEGAAPSGQPAPIVIDVEDEYAAPQKARPGEMLVFDRFAKAADFFQFADGFLPKTNKLGAEQFLNFYEITLVALEKGKPAFQAAAKDIRETIAAMMEPGADG